MKKWLFGFMAGMAAGMVVAFANEDELDDAYYKACKCKKKLIRKATRWISNTNPVVTGFLFYERPV